MNVKTTYLVLSFFGAFLACWQLVPWLAENGLNVTLFFQQLFANRISGFFAVDVFVSAAVLIIFILRESSRLEVRGWWLPLIAVLTVGVSLGFPLFLYMRELKLEQDRTDANSFDE
jgi:uncharacterized protein DUF2834